MGTFDADTGGYPVPPGGNDDFLPGSTILSGEMDGNFSTLRSYLNTQFVDNSIIVDNVISGGKLTDRTVVNIKLSRKTDPDGAAVTTDEIAADAVTDVELADNAVDTAAIQNTAVTSDKIDDLDGSKIQAGTVPLTALSFGVPSGPGNVAIGSVSWFAGASPPPGYLECNGQEIDDVVFSALNSVLGGIYDNHPQLGMPTPGFFRVPDIQSRSVVGTGSNNVLAESDGLAEALRDSPTHTHDGEVDLPAIPAHSHGPGTYSGSKTNQSTGTAENDPGDFETGNILTLAGFTGLNAIDGLTGGGNWGSASTAPGGGGGGVNFTKLVHQHIFNITGITIAGSSAVGGDYDPPPAPVTIDPASQPYVVLLPIIYAGA